VREGDTTMRDATLGEVQASGWFESPDPDYYAEGETMEQEPTFHATYIVTGHQFIRTRLGRGDDNPPVAIVLLHQYAHQANEPAPHRVYVPESELSHPAYRLGAMWKLVFTGENDRDQPDDY